MSDHTPLWPRINPFVPICCPSAKSGLILTSLSEPRELLRERLG